MIEKEIKMKTKKVVFCLLAVVVLGGCFPLLSSIHPLYTDDTIVFEERLVGKWADGDEIWQFNWDGEKAYKLRILEGDKEGLFEAHLVQLEDMMFLDVFPDGKTLEDVQPFYAIHLFPMHTFIKVEQTEPNLVLRMMDPDEVSKLLKNDPNLLKHEVTENDVLVLTAATQDLQKFVVEYANTEGVFGIEDKDEMVLSRREPFYTDEDVIFDEKLIGEWEGKDGGILNSIRAGEKSYDIISLDKDGHEYRFVANLVKANGSMLLAVFFGRHHLEATDPCAINLTPDCVVLVEQIEPKLLLRNVDYEDVAKMLDAAASFQAESGAYMFEGTRTVP
jgi:hypothetical protein